MKEASDCLDRALQCDHLAGLAQDADGSRLLRDLALQWRRLAAETARHKQLIIRSFPREDTAA